MEKSAGAKREEKASACCARNDSFWVLRCYVGALRGSGQARAPTARKHKSRAACGTISGRSNLIGFGAPVARWPEQLQADGKDIFTHGLAVDDAGFGLQVSLEGLNYHGLVGPPNLPGQHAGPTLADVFG